jgi:hypothetical protein
VTSTLNRRLRDHLSAHRADVRTSYLFEGVVAPMLKSSVLKAFGDGQLTIRYVVRNYLEHSARVVWVETASYSEAKAWEDAVPRGALGQEPLINPWPGELDLDA